MDTSRATRGGTEQVTVVAAARAGDSPAFAGLAERYRRELHVHCYRMLGSFEDAEDLVQETFLRAWRKRQTFQGRSTFRAWLYRIATNACLDFIARRNRALPKPAPPTSADSGMESQRRVEIPWLQPYPDRLLDEVPAPDSQPEDMIVAREGIELAFLAAIQLLAPRGRAVLILRDVLDWSAKETASLLETSVASVNSSLQRARLTLRQTLPDRESLAAPPATPSGEEQALLRRIMEATERADVGAFVELLRADARFSMPPQPEWYAGRDAIVRGWVEGGFGSASFGQLRCMITRANRQPALANYLRRPGETEFRSLTIDVLRIENGQIADVTTFYGKGLFERFGLPLVLENGGAGPR